MAHPSRSILSGVLVVGLAILAATEAGAGENGAKSAAEETDRLLAEEVFTSATGNLNRAPRTGDELFLRRVHLDLVGHLPAPTDLPNVAVKYPALGAVVAHEIPNPECELPRFIRVGGKAALILACVTGPVLVS